MICHADGALCTVGVFCKKFCYVTLNGGFLSTFKPGFIGEEVTESSTTRAWGIDSPHALVTELS